MKNEKLLPMEFISSNGTLLVNKDGTIHKDSDLSDWLLTIHKIDIEELDNYYKIQKIGKCEGGDVMDFGYWDKNGNYFIPEKQWRLDVFHNQKIKDKKEIQKTVEESFKWIEFNRK